jgi:hypothetical protein
MSEKNLNQATDADAPIERSIQPLSVAATALVFSATVSDGGVLAGGVGATRANRLRTGAYEVVFSANVAHGAYCATVACGNAGICEPPAYFASVSPRANNASAVWVQTWNAEGHSVDAGFNLIVTVG